MKRLVALLAAFLAGCATPYDALRDYSGADSGTVIASVGMTAENTMHFSSIEFKRRSTTDRVLLQFSPRAASAFGGTPADFSSSAGTATVLRKRLPPGEYEITSFSSGANYGTSTIWAEAPRKFSIPFTVRAGEVVYLGRYLVGLNLVNGKLSSSSLMISDESQRDLTKVGTVNADVRNEAKGIVKDAPSGIRHLN